MNDVEHQLLKALTDLESSVATMKTASPKPDLIPLFSRIEELSRQLPAETDPELRHFLDRKSYQKARLLLQGRSDEAPRGTCR